MNLKKEQIAMSNFPYYKYSMEYTLDSLQKIGAESIELYCADPHLNLDDATLIQVKILKKMLKDRNIRVICVCPEQVKYPINIASTNPASRKRSIEYYLKALQYASELECPTVQFFAGWGTLDSDYDETWKRSVESVSFLAKAAETYGIHLTLEAAHDFDTVLYNSSRIAAMLKEVHSPNLHGMIDLYCLKVCNETIDEAIDNLDKKVYHVHFSDAAFCEAGSAHTIPGTGELDLDYMLEKLDGINYKGYLSLELMSPYEKCPEHAMRTAYEWLESRLS